MAVEEIQQLDDAQIEEADRDFSDLLNTIDSLGGKKKHLWRDIYRNAQQDRHNAFILFRELYELVMDTTANPPQMKSSEMAVHGRTLAGYMEMQKKANDQLLKLADLVAQEEEKQKDFAVQDAYNQIGELKS